MCKDAEKQSSTQSSAKFRSLAELQRDFWRQQQEATRVKLMKEGVQPSGSASSLKEGTVRKVVESKGFAFLTTSDASISSTGDVFLHFSDLVGCTAKDIAIGTCIKFKPSYVEPDRVRACNAVIADNCCEESTISMQQRSIAGQGRHGLRKAASEAASISTVADQAAVNTQDLKSTSTEEVLLDDSSDNEAGLRTYDRLMLLSYYQPFVAGGAKPTSKVVKCVPTSMLQKSRTMADPSLDDEARIGMLETRLSAETGADALNLETFGEQAGGWSFEDALKANQRILATGKELEQSSSSTTASSGAPSETECA
mmetsp:Transcript_38822/g.91304  ORF Transcript_38822/g.91304 Transcript_38822/m.91304 type:complete len:312 (+) Transcript_38822:173-1108(+)